MQFAVDIAPLGELADPNAIVRLARTAEASGWDGLSTWDSLGVSMGAPAADPFVALAAVASVTEHLRLIASVLILPRRRPQLVAQAAATLDRLSSGRFILGVGAGGDPGDFTVFGEDDARGPRIEAFDARVSLVDRYLRGQAVDEAGISFPGGGSTIGPEPVQRPRPPIWVGGDKPGARRRAARWDGWIAITIADDGVSVVTTPAAFGAGVEAIRAERDRLGTGGAPFDIAVFGQAGLAGTDPASYAAAGATWWLETVSPMRGTLDQLVSIVASGPPR